MHAGVNGTALDSSLSPFTMQCNLLWFILLHQCRQAIANLAACKLFTAGNVQGAAISHLTQLREIELRNARSTLHCAERQRHFTSGHQAVRAQPHLYPHPCSRVYLLVMSSWGLCLPELIFLLPMPSLIRLHMQYLCLLTFMTTTMKVPRQLPLFTPTMLLVWRVRLPSCTMLSLFWLLPRGLCPEQYLIHPQNRSVVRLPLPWL